MPRFKWSPSSLVTACAVLFLVLAMARNTFAIDYVWSAAAAGNWTVVTNWTPNGLPGANDTVTFSGASVVNATVDANFAVKAVTLAAGYTGTVAFTNSATLTIGSGGFTQAAGTFNFSSSGGISCASNWLATAGNSSCSNPAVVLNFNEPAGNFTFTQQSSSYGAVTHSGAGIIQCVDSFGLFTQGTFTQSGTGSFIFSANQQLLLGNIVVSAGTMDMHASTALFGGFGKSYTQTGGAFLAPPMWALRGKFAKSGGTFDPGTGLITFEAQVTTDTLDTGGSPFFNFQYFSSINTTVVNNDVVINGRFDIVRQDSNLGIFDLNGHNLTVAGFTQISDGTLNCGSGSVVLGGGVNIRGAIVPNIPKAANGTLVMGSGPLTTTDLTLLGTSTTNTGIGTLTLGTGTLTMSGNFSRPAGFTSPSVFTANTGTIEFNKASGTQTVENQGSGSFYNLKHTGAGTLSPLNVTLSVNGTFTQTAGTFLNNGQNASFNGPSVLSRPAGGICLVDSGTAPGFFQGGLTIQGATVTNTGAGAAYFNGTVLASNGVGGDKSTLAGVVNLFGVIDTFDVAAGSELLIPGAVTNGSLTKANAGTLTLSAATDNYTGATLVNGGTLAVNSILSTSAVTVNAGATLTGAGSVGALTVANGGTLSPAAGSTGGSLTAVGNTSLSSGSVFRTNLRGTGLGQIDKIFVQGTVNLDGTALTGTSLPFVVPVGTKLVILDNDSTDAIVGTFTGLPEGATVVLSTRKFTISYKGGSGNDVELTTLNSPPAFAAPTTATPNPAQPGATVAFQTTVIDPDGDSVTYAWDFGDGSTGSGPAPTHVYALGSYMATVTVSDGVNPAASQSVAVVVSNQPPVFTGSASATPNPAGVGQTVAFSAAATDSDTANITYTWNFGDGTSAVGASVTHTYSSASVYSATVSVSDGIAAPVTQTLMVTVLAPKIGVGTDSDGDGFPDAFEAAAGSDASNAASTPTGQSAAASQINVLVVSKAAIKLIFNKIAGDTITFSGTLPIPAGFAILNTKVTLDVGGVAKSFTLDAKGSAKSSSGSAKFPVKLTKKLVLAQSIKYSIVIAKGSYAALLAADGLTNTNATKAPVSVPIALAFGNSLFAKTQPMVYTAKAGKAGAAK